MYNYCYYYYCFSLVVTCVSLETKKLNLMCHLSQTKGH